MTTEVVKMKNPDVTYSKHKISWFEAWLYLDMGKVLGALSDEGFKERFKALEDYVLDKIEPQFGGDIVDTYVIVEQAKEKNSQNA